MNISFETLEVIRLGKLIHRSKDNNFQEFFLEILIAGAKFQVLSNLATCSNYSITNYVKNSVFHFFDKVNKGQLKMVHVNYKNWPDITIMPSS